MADDPKMLAAALLAEVGWVRNLAAQLVGSQSGDDVAQDAWLVATRGNPSVAEPMRPWLAAVVRKLAHTRKRSEARRKAHEASAAVVSTDQPTPETLLARAETLHLLGELVSGLAEPYRSTILLRYYEGLTSQQIAERLGIADGTVRWRLAEGVEQLRRALDGRVQDGRRGWMLALGAASLPKKLMHAKSASAALGLKIAGVVSVFAVGTVVAVTTSHHSRRPAAHIVESGHSGDGVDSRVESSTARIDRSSATSPLADAQRAYVSGHYEEAIQLAAQVKSDEPAKAWRVIGASSCFLGDSTGAGSAWTHLDRTGRKFVEYVCSRNQVSLPKQEDGQKIL